MDDGRQLSETWEVKGTGSTGVRKYKNGLLKTPQILEHKPFWHKPQCNGLKVKDKTVIDTGTYLLLTF